MKKLMKLIVMTIGALFLVACGSTSSLNGVYKAESSGINYKLVIEEEDVTISTDFTGANLKMKGKLNESDKTITLFGGSFLGLESEQTIEYRKVDDTIEIIFEDETAVFKKVGE